MNTIKKVTIFNNVQAKGPEQVNCKQEVTSASCLSPSQLIPSSEPCMGWVQEGKESGEGSSDNTAIYL
jgi:hypothetical protein